MKDFIIYTTQGTTNAPNLDVDIDNCQVLGIVKATTGSDAINKLFKNEWIQNAEFTKDKVVVKQLFSSSIKEDIMKVIDYLWNLEFKHCQENDFPSNHIFRTLQRIKESL